MLNWHLSLKWFLFFESLGVKPLHCIEVAKFYFIVIWVMTTVGMYKIINLKSYVGLFQSVVNHVGICSKTRCSIQNELWFTLWSLCDQIERPILMKAFSMSNRNITLLWLNQKVFVASTMNYFLRYFKLMWLCFAKRTKISQTQLFAHVRELLFGVVSAGLLNLILYRWKYAFFVIVFRVFILYTLEKVNRFDLLFFFKFYRHLSFFRKFQRITMFYAFLYQYVLR